MPESQLYRVPLRWLGVRPLQILQRFDLPDDAFQYFSEGDATKCRSLMASSFCQSHPRWQEEVEAMVRFLFLFKFCVCLCKYLCLRACDFVFTFVCIET